MTFTPDSSKFPDVPHIQDDEKAFGTQNNPGTSPAKQFQSLTDRTAYLAQRLKIEDPALASVYDLLTPLSELLDENGKLPFNRLLATDTQGNVTTIAIPKVSFTRVAIATLQSSERDFANPGTWSPRVLNAIVTTKPSGIPENWLTTNGRDFTLNSPGQYLIHLTAIGAMLDAHQIRLRREPDNQIFNGIIAQTADAPVSGHTIMTASEVSAAFTIGVPDSPEPPVTFKVEHFAIKSQTPPAALTSLDFGFPAAGTPEVYINGSIIHIAIQTVSITDTKAVVIDFGSIKSREAQLPDNFDFTEYKGY